MVMLLLLKSWYQSEHATRDGAPAKRNRLHLLVICPHDGSPSRDGYGANTKRARSLGRPVQSELVLNAPKDACIAG